MSAYIKHFNLNLNLNIFVFSFFLLIFKLVTAQEINLNIKSIDSIENNILKTIDFEKKHLNSASLKNEISMISELLKKRGYFFNELDSIITLKEKKIAFIKLNNKISTVIISSFFKDKKKTETLTVEELESYLNSISLTEEKKGQLFSEISLKEIHLQKDTLFALLDIKKSKKRKIDKIIINSYPEFSFKKVKYFLGIKKEIINNDEITYISKNTKDLQFLSEIKPPEILFKKDSTLLYLYLKRKKNNSFDGIVNFSSKENEKGLLFTGHLKLNLNNMFNSGEEFKIHWLANGEQRQSFLFYSKLPYLFNSPLTPEISFKIHRQDSTFLNNTNQLNINYPINKKTNLALAYTRKNSKNTIDNLEPNQYQDYISNFIGLNFTYSNYKKNRLDISINPSIGNRNSEKNREQQLKLTSKIKYTLQLNQKNEIFVSNTSGILKSENIFINELFRIGGVNSIRGFDEESIFSSEFSYFNTEYRYKTSYKSHLFTIIDFGFSKNIDTAENLSSLGLGYSTKNKNTLLKLGVITEKRGGNSYDLNNLKLIIQLISFF